MTNLPVPSRLRYIWNFGSILFIILIIQIIRGLLLRINYNVGSPFETIVFFTRDTLSANVVYWVHIMFASLFFVGLYLHLLRGLLYSSFTVLIRWSRGFIILLLLIAIAFLGYVLPWGQISLWGATVITNLVSAVPVFGASLVIWIWGGFRVTTVTLNCFYRLHFLLPFILAAIAIIHVILLHISGSTSLSASSGKTDRKFWAGDLFKKDLGNLSVLLFVIIRLLLVPYLCGDPENFNYADSLSSPLHIKPEWYFLFAYAILRSIPRKSGGVLALLASVLIIGAIINQLRPKKGIGILSIIWILIITSLLLTWIGGNAVEAPYILIGQILSISYFAILIITLI